MTRLQELFSAAQNIEWELLDAGQQRIFQSMLPTYLQKTRYLHEAVTLKCCD